MNRIETISFLVEDNIVADIGSDHGLVLKNLFENGLVSHAFSTDISPLCLEKSKTTLKNFLPNCTFLCGNGLQVFGGNLPQKSQNILPKQIIITGMGGNEISKILLQKEAQQFDKFILGPQKNVAELRVFLAENNFKFLFDRVVKDGKKYYTIMSVKRENFKTPLAENEILFGTFNATNPDKTFVEFAKKKVTYYKNILQNLTKLENNIEDNGSLKPCLPHNKNAQIIYKTCTSYCALLEKLKGENYV